VQPAPREKSVGAARLRSRIARQDLGYFPAAWCDQSRARARGGSSATRDDADAVPACGCAANAISRCRRGALQYSKEVYFQATGVLAERLWAVFNTPIGMAAAV